MRVSSYIIPTKVDEDNYMLVHGYSGAIDLVPTDVAELLIQHEGLENLSKTMLDSDTLQSLISRGYITDKSHEEEIEHVARIARILHKRDKLMNVGVTLVVTYDCNFRCPYCFERGSVKHSSQRTMTKDVVDKAFKIVDSVSINKPKPLKYITLFGGEPLLKENLEIVEYIVEQGTKRNIHFKAVTNGYDLDCYSHLLNDKSIDQIQVTIDGLKTSHNKKRVHYLGVPTFDKIIQNIEMAISKGISVVIRVNTDKTNFSEMISLKQYLEDKGLFKTGRLQLDSAKLVNYNGDKSNRYFDQKSFLEAHHNNDMLQICHDFSTYNKISDSISRGVPIPYRATFCSAQNGGLVLDPFYKIYPCWEVIGDKNQEIGSYENGCIKWNEIVMNKWTNGVVTDISKCHSCKCALLCGGGCFAHMEKSDNCTRMADLIRFAVRHYYNIHYNHSFN